MAADVRMSVEYAPLWKEEAAIPWKQRREELLKRLWSDWNTLGWSTSSFQEIPWPGEEEEAVGCQIEAYVSASDGSFDGMTHYTEAFYIRKGGVEFLVELSGKPEAAMSARDAFYEMIESLRFAEDLPAGPTGADIFPF